MLRAELDTFDFDYAAEHEFNVLCSAGGNEALLDSGNWFVPYTLIDKQNPNRRCIKKIKCVRWNPKGAAGSEIVIKLFAENGN